MSSLANEKFQLLKWLAYDKVLPLSRLSDWHDFTRRVCFYSTTGSKDHESLLVPTLGAHMLRSEYVLETVFGCINNEPINPREYGWRVNEPMIKRLLLLVRDVVARVMGQLQDVGTVIECVRLVILGEV